MRYKVPQNIDMEDRIVGPLTMVQFVLVMVGGMLVYLAYTLFTPSTFWFAAIPIALVTLTLAFVKVNDQPFPKFLAATILFLVRPKNRVWQKEDGVENLKIVHKDIPTAASTAGQSSVQRSQLESLSASLDTGGAAPIPTTPAVATATPAPQTQAPTTPAAPAGTLPIEELPTLGRPMGTATPAETAPEPNPGVDQSWGHS